jgi:hypothetical protein
LLLANNFKHKIKNKLCRRERHEGKLEGFKEEEEQFHVDKSQTKAM